MLFRRAPDMSIAPAAEFTQLLHLLMLLVQVILDWQLSGIEDADIASKAMKNARGFKSH